jgi:hypothetical protein
MGGTLHPMMLQHEVIIEAYEGTTGKGQRTYAAASAPIRCFVDEKTRMVRSPTTGREIVSGATVYAPLDTVCPIESRVILPSGRVGQVLNVLRRDGGALPVPSHLEIVLD